MIIAESERQCEGSEMAYLRLLGVALLGLAVALATTPGEADILSLVARDAAEGVALWWNGAVAIGATVAAGELDAVDGLAAFATDLLAEVVALRHAVLVLSCQLK